MVGSDAGHDEVTVDLAGAIRFKPEALQRCARLTRRERDVLEVLATGASTDEVASRLRMSTDEVRRHLRSCLWTLQARSKLEAVLLALAAGVIGESLK